MNNQYISLANWGLVKACGEKAADFLQGQLTCDVTRVNAQSAAFSALCNPQGRVLATFFLCKKEDAYYCFLPDSTADDFIQHLSKFAVFSKVRLEHVTENVHLYGYIGETALLSQKFSHIPAQPYDVMTEDGVIINVSITTPQFLIWSNQPFSDVEVIMDNAAWKQANILAGRPTIYMQTRGMVTPHMLNLHLLDAVSFNKGCYVGQEIIARTHYLGKSKRYLCRAEVPLAMDLCPGELLHADGQEAGVLIEAVDTAILAVMQAPLERRFTLQQQPVLSLLPL